MYITEIRGGKPFAKRRARERECERCADIHVIPRRPLEVMHIDRINLQVERGARDGALVNFNDCAPVLALLHNRAWTQVTGGARVDGEARQRSSPHGLERCS